MHSSTNRHDIPLEKNNGLVLPDSFTHSCPDSWQLCGEGVFSWSVFRFYEARLLTQTGVFDPVAPFLLSLHYLRKLPGQQIVSTSIDEIARLADVEPKRLREWSEALMRIIPDVSLGDQLLGWFVPGVRVTFYSATQELGRMDDPVFVNAFSAIWLDERTRSPHLRHALLGGHAVTSVDARSAPPLSNERRA